MSRSERSGKAAFQCWHWQRRSSTANNPINTSYVALRCTLQRSVSNLAMCVQMLRLGVMSSVSVHGRVVGLDTGLCSEHFCFALRVSVLLFRATWNLSSLSYYHQQQPPWPPPWSLWAGTPPISSIRAEALPRPLSTSARICFAV